MGGKKSKKKEYEALFNELFGVEIRWSKLPLEDLEVLAQAITSQEFCSKACKPSSVLASLIDEIIPPEDQGLVIKALKKLLKG